MRGYALQELNVWSLKTSDEVGKWSNVHVEPNNKLLGKRLGKDRAKVRGEGGKGKTTEQVFIGQFLMARKPYKASHRA